MELSLAVKGRECVQLARRVATELEHGTVVHSSSNLQKLEVTGTELAKHTEELAKRLKKVQEFNIKQVEEKQRQIGECGKQERDKQQQMDTAQSSLDANRRILADNQTRLAKAKTDLSSAVSRLSNEKKKRKKRKKTFGIVGAAVGVCTAGLGGAAVGAVGGAMVGKAISDKQVNEAQRAVGHREQDCKSAQSSIDACERQISTIRSQLSSLTNQKDQLERQRREYHDKATQLKEAISFLQEAVTFWQMFKQLSDHSTNRTTLLRKIVEKADSQVNPGVLSSKPTQRLAGTVLDVWTEMETTAEQGSTRFSFTMEYRCSKCNKTHNNIPHIFEEKLINSYTGINDLFCLEPY